MIISQIGCLIRVNREGTEKSCRRLVIQISPPVRLLSPHSWSQHSARLFNMRRGPPQLSSPRPHAVQPQNYPAGAASAARSTVSGEGVLRALLRQPSRFTVHAFDEHGNRCTTGGAPFVLAVRGPSSASRTIVDAGDGTFHAAWVPTVTGAYTVAVTLHGELVGGAPFVVHAGTPHADISRSSVEGEGLHHAVAGELASFRVQFADEHGAPAAVEQLALVLAPKGGLGGESPGLIYCGVAEGADGGHTASYSVRRAGEYALTVQLRGGAVLAGSPFSLRVLAAAPYAPACELACEAARYEEGGRLHLVAGERLRLRLHVRDRWGNACEAEAVGILTSQVEAGG